MGLRWYDSSQVPFDALLLLDRCQVGWFCARKDFSLETVVAFNSSPHVLWYFSHKNPSVKPWVDRVRAERVNVPKDADIRAMEIRVLESMQDWIAYVWDPALYENQPFVVQQRCDLLRTADFRNKWVLDVGSGTGRLALEAATLAAVAYACEPIENLRVYIRRAAACRGLANLYVVDGMIESLPFPDGIFDIVTAGYVFGDDMPGEMAELRRVAKTDGTVMLVPGNIDQDNDRHHFLVDQGFCWEAYSESSTSRVRKYWQRPSLAG